MLAVHRLFIFLWLVFLPAFGAYSFAESPPDFPVCPVPRGSGPTSPTQGQTQPGSAPTPIYDFKIVHSYPHDPEAFTQGLIFEDGFLFESTGRVGKSTLRKVELETGKVLKSYALSGTLFGEGLTLWRNRLIQLTWKSGIGFVYDKESFVKASEFRYETEGWGITCDGKSLIMSDGTATLRFLDPDGFTEIGQIEVKDHGQPVTSLNELEYIKGEIFANVWCRDVIARISSATGQVLGWIDLSELKDALGPVRSMDVLNGIAYDARQDRIFVTGKLWPRLFEIELIRRE